MDDSWNLNVRAHFVAVRLVITHMKRQGGGSIVITSSNSGVQQYDREMIAYATSKYAVVAMTRQIALDYARFNIRVNALYPGWVGTPFNDPFTRQMGGRQALEKYIREQIPMGRRASADGSNKKVQNVMRSSSVRIHPPYINNACRYALPHLRIALAA